MCRLKLVLGHHADRVILNQALLIQSVKRFPFYFWVCKLCFQLFFILHFLILAWLLDADGVILRIMCNMRFRKIAMIRIRYQGVSLDGYVVFCAYLVIFLKHDFTFSCCRNLRRLFFNRDILLYYILHWNWGKLNQFRLWSEMGIEH